MNGSYLAFRVKYLSGPIVAFLEYFFRDVLPTFADLNARAEQVAHDYYDQVGAQPAGDHEIDMADVAEDARQRSYDWWEMMTSLRQAMLNLTAAGLFHLVEQQLATLSRDGLFEEEPVPDTKLEVVQEWYRDRLGIDVAALPSWETIDEMRLVANTVKHGEGRSAEKLKALRPELFADPMYAELLQREGLGLVERVGRERFDGFPLSGEDFFVTEEILRGYAERAKSFFGEIAEELVRRG